MTKNSSDDGRRAAAAMARSCLALRCRRLSRVVSRLYEEALRPLGISTAQLNILVAVTAYGPLRPAEVAAELGLDPSSITRNVARMEEAGWVLTQAAAFEDRRGRLVETTAAGLRCLQRAYPAWLHAQQRARRLLGAKAFEALGDIGDSVAEG